LDLQGLELPGRHLIAILGRDARVSQTRAALEASGCLLRKLLSLQYFTSKSLNNHVVPASAMRTKIFSRIPQNLVFKELSWWGIPSGLAKSSAAETYTQNIVK
jgi:hypothetical protein